MIAILNSTKHLLGVSHTDREATTKQRHSVLQGWEAEDWLCVVLCGWQRWRKETGTCHRKVSNCC